MIGMFQKSANTVAEKVLLLVMLFTVTSIFSQEINYFGPRSLFTAHQMNNEIVLNTDSFQVVDPQINQPNHASLNLKSYIRLKAKSDVPGIAYTKTSIKVKLEYFLSNGTIDPALEEIITLQVTYNPLSNAIDFNDVTEHIKQNTYGIKVTFQELKTEYLPSNVVAFSVQPNIEVEIGFECERYYQLTQQQPIITSSIIPDPDTAKPGAIRFEWSDLLGAEEYELEWTWVDNFGNPATDNSITTLPETAVFFSSRDFETNCTRIRTKNIFYEIPAVYSHGFIIYRVRGVGRFWNSNPSTPFFGQWSSSSTGNKVKVSDWGPDFIEIEDHEKAKNWQFQSSYAEEGKKKEVVSYFDGTLRNRQTVTKVNTDNNAVVGEVIYDNQGRAAIEVLPVPLFQKNYIRYFSQLNKSDGTSSPYSHYDFDWDTDAICSGISVGMKTSSGASKYYSPSNDFDGSTLHRDFIPDAFSYPFSQIEYTPDNTGRISKKGGVGFTHQIGKGHEMKYFYTSPYQSELDRLFGYSVGYASHYKKNIVIDPNGQASVSYIDPQGRTIATALTGGEPPTMEHIPYLPGDHPDSVIVDLLNNIAPNHLNTPNQQFPSVEDNNILGSTGVFPTLNDKLTFSKEIIVAGNNIPHEFNYTISNDSYFTPDRCSDKYGFVYDLKLSLKDVCSIERFSEFDHDVNSKYKKIGHSQISSDAIVSVPEDIHNFVESLNTGSYTLSKELKVNEDALNAYADAYIAKIKDSGSGTNCYVPQHTFISSNAGNECSTDCLDCKNKLGPLADYVTNQLKDYYNNGSFVYPGSGTATFTDETEDYNGEGTISVTEVASLVQKYKDEWANLFALCDRMCGPVFISSCSISEDTMLSDVSPKGQYGSDELINTNTYVDPEGVPGDPIYEISDVLSVFNSTTAGSQLYSNGETTANDWRNPLPDYKDDNGEDFYVEIELNTETTAVDDYKPEIVPNAVIQTIDVNGHEVKRVLPKYLKNIADFLPLWKPEWAQSLLIYHPEYCYLQYTKALCAKTRPVAVLKSPSGTETESRDLSTDEYDDYLEYIDTFQGAVNAGFADSGTGINAISLFNKDPYFGDSSGLGLGTNYETANQYIWRKAIMTDGINNYQNHGHTMLMEAYMIVLCNSINNCDTSSLPGSMSTEQKNKVWNTYKNLYKSLKGKIKYVFINLYAKRNGCYNGCIGTDSDATITNVLTSHVGNVLGDFNNPPDPYDTTQLCTNATAINYLNKQKRFIPADFGYDSALTPQDAMNQLTAQGDYQQYVQTGSCPLLFDMEMFLDGHFQHLPSGGILAADQDLGQYLTADLLRGMVQNPSLVLPRLSSDPPVKINTAVSTGDKTLTFSFTNLTSSNALTLTIPSTGTGSGLTWNNHGTEWTIVEFKQFFYDELQSNLTVSSNLDFAFSAIAVIARGSGQQEVLITGHTRAAVGECGINNDGIGQVLDSNTATNDDMAGCSKKYKFSEAFLKFLNQLRRDSKLFLASTPLSAVSYYSETYLKEFFQEPAGTITSTWNYNSGVFQIIRGGVSIFTMTATIPTNINNFEAIIIGNPTSSAIPFTLYYTEINGNKTPINGTFNKQLNFSCCDTKQIVPVFALRTSTFVSNSAPYDVHDIYFKPKNTTILLNTDFTMEFSVEKPAGPGHPRDDFASYNSQIKIDGVSKPVSFLAFGYSGGTQLVPPSFNRLSWCYCDNSTQPFYGARYEVDNLFYKIISSNSTTERLFEFNSNNLLSSSEVSPITMTYLDHGNVGTPSYSGYGLTLGNWKETRWDQEAPFYFTDDAPLNLNFKMKLKFTDVLPYISTNPAYSDFGTIAQISYSDNPSNVDVKYDLFVYGENKTEELCSGCIPQPVKPVVCQDAYAAYVSIMTTRLGVSINDIYTEQEFCTNNLGYLVESYHYYLDTFSITSTEDPHYLTLIEFGNTKLNFGYSKINEVITAYQSYLASSVIPVYNNEDSNTDNDYYDDLDMTHMGWTNYVNTIYMVQNPVCPPAAMPVNSLVVEPGPSPCDYMLDSVTSTYQDDSYQSYLDNLKKEFIADYIKAAMETVAEQFTMKYRDDEYQYTLYYYDQAGNLIQTVPPKGVVKMDQSKFPDITTQRNSNGADDADLVPGHTLQTQYKYNSLNQLVWQSTPDGGIIRFAYDKLGRIIASQKKTSLSADKMSYTTYDPLGRITEAGEVIFTEGQYTINENGKLFETGYPDPQEKFEHYLTKREVTKTIYDIDPKVETTPADVYSSQLFVSNAGTDSQYNNRNRVTAVYSYDIYDENDELNYDYAIFYNYDIHGNVKELINYYPFLAGDDANESKIRRILYDYDLISGNVKKVIYQPNRPGEPRKKDLFIHKYEYDADNRIVNVQTSKDGEIWEKDANYKYYPHGPLARVEIGDKKVQGIDYAYTLQSWLKLVNGESLQDKDLEMNHDGSIVNKDVFGYSLNYYDAVENTEDPSMDTKQDYNAIQNDNGTQSFLPLKYSRNNSIQGTSNNLFNGNIKKMVTAMSNATGVNLPTQVNSYKYDQLNRLVKMNSSAVYTNNDTKQDSYSSEYIYDPNGNISYLKRRIWNNSSPSASPILMDSLKYDYKSYNNQLKLVHDFQLNHAVDSNDLEDQVNELGVTYDENDASPNHNYIYDDFGQLIEDKSEKIHIEWRNDGKVSRITNNKTFEVITFQYDGLGNRIAKTRTYNGKQTRTYYSRDAQGNVMAVYNINLDDPQRKIVKLIENHIYGSSRLGLEEGNVVVADISLPMAKSKGRALRTPAKDIAKDKDSAQAKTGGYSMLSTPVSVSDLTNYSLHLPSGTTSTWSIPQVLNTDNNAVSDDFELQTRVRVEPNAVFDSNNEILISKTEFNQKLNKTVTQDEINIIDRWAIKLEASPLTTNFKIQGGGSNYFEKQDGSADANLTVGSDYNLKGAGEVQFQMISGDSKNIIFGLSYADDTDTSPSNMRYKVVCTPNGTANNGFVECFKDFTTSLGSPTAYATVATGNKLYIRLKRSGSVITFSLVTWVSTTNYSEQVIATANETGSGTTPMIIEAFLPPNPTGSSLPYNTSRLHDLTVKNYAGSNNNLVETVIDPKLNTSSVGTHPFTATSNIAVEPNSKTIYSTSNTFGTGRSSFIVFPAGTDGYVERTIRKVNDSYITNGFVEFGLGYSTSTTTNDYNLQTLCSSGNTSCYFVARGMGGVSYTPITQFAHNTIADGEKLRVEKKNGYIFFKRIMSDGTEIVNGINKIALSDLSKDLYVKFLFNRTTDVTGSSNQQRELYDLKVVKYIPASEDRIALRNMEFRIKKTSSGYLPIVKTKSAKWDFISNPNTYTTTLSNYVTASATADVSFSTMAESGFEFSFNNKVSGQSTPRFVINGITYNDVVKSTSTNSTAATTAQSGFGSNNFYMCYFNYKFGTGTNAVGAGFDFSSNSTTNPILSTIGTASLAVAPNVIKALGPCLYDEDHDGIYDIYEDVDSNGDIANDDSDNDGTPNYLDNDDDNDTVLTIYEGVNADGDYNPSTGTLLNTDGDGTPNYLDTDDDNDGYATWEATEYDNSDGDGNPTTGIILDSDSDGIPNYLDPTQDTHPVDPDPVGVDYYNWTGDKRYELNNHLGNVLVVINDKKIPDENNGYFCDVLSYSDYYPFGSLLPHRHGSSDSYRYGFQGQEKDDEIKGEGNSMNYTFRMYDPRVGRFFATDPLEKKYPFYSPYQFSGNRVVDMVELEGLEPAKPVTVEGERVNAIDQTAVANHDYYPSDLAGYIFGSTANNKLYKSWVSHMGTETTNPGWIEESDYKQMVMPFAIDYAQSEGWSFGYNWESAKNLICNPSAPSNFISQQTNDFLSSRTTTGDYHEYLTQIGANAINSANKSLYGGVKGSLTPMELDSPFFVLGLGSRFTNIATGVAKNEVRVGQWMTSQELEGFNNTGIVPRTNVLTKGMNGYIKQANAGDIYVEFNMQKSLLVEKDPGLGWSLIKSKNQMHIKMAEKKGQELLAPLGNKIKPVYTKR